MSDTPSSEELLKAQPNIPDSPPPSSEELLKAFPEWTEREEVLWLDVYQEAIPLLIGARLDPDSPLHPVMPNAWSFTKRIF